MSEVRISPAMLDLLKYTAEKRHGSFSKTVETRKKSKSWSDDALHFTAGWTDGHPATGGFNMPALAADTEISLTPERRATSRSVARRVRSAEPEGGSVLMAFPT